MRRAVFPTSIHAAVLGLALAAMVATSVPARTQKPALQAKTWLAITGKPLAATAGARMFERGGNAVDAACAMLAAMHQLHKQSLWRCASKLWFLQTLGSWERAG